MNISQYLQKGHTKKRTLAVGKFVGKDASRFNEIVKLVIGKDELIAQRAAWVLGIHGEKNPTLVVPHLNKLIPRLGMSVHNGVKRNILRVLQYLKIPEKFESAVVSQCFDLLLSSEEPPAVKAFSITVIVNLSKKYPDLLQELNAWFEHNKSVASKAEFKRMARAGFLNPGIKKPE